MKIERTKNKVVIGGKTYYVHIVKAGETLYSISKAYNVSQKEIAQENSNIILGFQVQIDQVLKIPFNIENGEEEVKETDKYIYHVIKENQTIYFLSKLYNIEIDEILKYNSEIKFDDLQIGQVIKIPRNKVKLIKEKIFTEDENYIYYKVEKNQTLYSLSIKYNVTIAQIEKANEEMQEIMKAGQFIKIPKIKKDTLETILFGMEPFFPDLLNYFEDSLNFIETSEIPCDTFHYDYFSNTLSIALFLPLYLDENVKKFDIDSFKVNKEGIKIIERDPDYIYSKSINYIEFYEGVLLALDSLKNTGLSVNLYTYDTERNPEVVKEIIKGREFESMDLIIGPFYSLNLEIVAEFARKNKINIISPVSTKSEFLYYNPYLFQVTPSLTVGFDQLTSFISDFYDKNIILIHSGDGIDSEEINNFKYKLFINFSSKTYIDDVIYKEIIYHDSLNINLEHSLSVDTENIVIVPSNNEAFVSAIVTQMHTYAIYYNYNITLFGFPIWQQFESIEPEYFHYLQLHIYSPFYIDYKKENIKKFIKKYREFYRSDPYRITSMGYNYSFLGYDIIYYFLNAIKNYGINFQNCIGDFQFNLLQSDYQFKRKSFFSGFENTGIYIIRYNKDLNIQKLDISRDNP